MLETNKLITDSKMTENEAIKVIQNIFPTRKIGRIRGFYNFDCELGKALLLAILSLKKIQKYQAIGSVRDCRKAMEKQRAKAPYIWGDGTNENGQIIYDMYNCPNCGKSYEIDFDDYKYCPECGQKIERTNLK